jgi:hypothetical protein
MKVVSYFAASGAISGWLQDDRVFDSSWFAHDMGFIEVQEGQAIDREAQYVSGGALTARPASPCTLDKPTVLANGTDTATISSIPSGAVATITDANGTATHTITDGVIELTGDDAGTIRVTVVLFPYLDWTATVTLT